MSVSTTQPHRGRRSNVASSHAESSSLGDGPTALWSVLMVFLVAYAVHALVVVISHRHLYGDAASYLVQMVSEGGVTQFYVDFSREFYYSRFLAYSLTQSPTVVAFRLGISDLPVLSTIYGATFFAWKFLSLAACYWLLPKHAKALIVFPLLGVVAGTINSEIYLVTEIHVSTAFLWPLLIALICLPTPLTRARALCLALAIAATSFLYESMALLLLIPLAMLLWRLRRGEWARDEIPNAIVLIAMLTAGIVMNWAAILFPRDPVNKSAFVQGVYLILHDAFQGIGRLHVGPTASIGFLLVAAVVMVTSGLPRKVVGWLGAACLAILPTLHFLSYRESLVFWNSITDRGFSGVVMQCAFAALLVLAYSVQRFRSQVVSPEFAILVGGLIIGQLSWQAMATKAWIEATVAVRQVLATGTGPQFCPSLSAEYSKSLSVALDRILCGWWVSPLSIVLAPRGEVKSIVLSSDSFRPFDPLLAASLPSMRFAPVKYDQYLQSLAAGATLARGDTVAFTTKGQGWLLTTSGFSSPEPWGTWSEGKSAWLRFCVKDGGVDKMGVRLKFKTAAFVPDQRPRLVVAVSAGERSVEEWVFDRGDAIVERFVEIPNESIDKGCARMKFTMSDLASPASLGISGDPRGLGLALVEMKVER